MQDLRTERFSDLSPEQLHQQQRRFAAAMGGGIATMLGDDPAGPCVDALFPPVPYLTLPGRPHVPSGSAVEPGATAIQEKLT